MQNKTKRVIYLFITQVLVCLSGWYHACAMFERAGTVSWSKHIA